MANLAASYRPNKFEDVCEQSVIVNILKNICSQDVINHRNFLFIGPAGCGKAQPLYSSVLTINGFIPMRDVQIGTKVITHNGNVGNVIGIYPQGVRPIYQLVLEDDRHIEVADNHLNYVCVRKNNREDWRKIPDCPTLDLLDKFKHNYDIMIPAAYIPDTYDFEPKSVNCGTSHIKDISYLGDDECQCIMIDHEDHTYISDNFIPTHNTTLGRIVANTLNDGIGEPIEIDAASNNGVDSARELVKQMRTYPVGCKYKVFIIDECHSLSSQAWQIFLKPIEEQPAKTIIILCTTNPEKIPATILSRVQTFQLSKISLDGIVSRLKYIIEQENIKNRNIVYTDDAISYIAKLANGGMRDSITLLEKSLSFSDNINIENLTKSLDLPNYDDYFILLNGIAKKDNSVIVKLINDVYNSGVNFVKWFEGFHSFVSNIIKYIFIQDINATMIPSHYQDKIANYGIAHATLCLKLANKLVKMNQELKSTQYLQELAITYLCQMPQPKRS